MDFYSQIKPIKRNTIILDENYKPGSDIPLGCSKSGGEPDLLEDFQWPLYKEKT